MASPRQGIRDRLIETAVKRIESQGMTVSLEHLSLERIIAESGVSRASAYRHWPSKAAFLTEVLTTVVRTTRLDGESVAEMDDLVALIVDGTEDLTSAQGRRNLVVEGLRRAARSDFERVVTSPRWRTYLALHATCQGLPEGPLRTEVLAELAQAERRFTAQRAEVYSRLPSLLGYRLVPPLSAPDGFEVMADAAGALMTGMVVRALTLPDVAERTMSLRAFGATRDAEWTWPAHHLAALILSYLEPDPEIVWDAAQVARGARTLTTIMSTLAAAAKRNDAR